MKKLIPTILLSLSLLVLYSNVDAQVLPSAGAEWKYKASLYLNSTDEYFDTTLIVKVQKDTIIEGVEMKMLIRNVYPCANIGSDTFFIYSIDSKVMQGCGRLAAQCGANRRGPSRQVSP